MPEQSNHVRPGDLITAEFMNDLLERVDALADQVEELKEQQGNLVRIDGFRPSAEEGVPLGWPLTIFGSAFRVPPQENDVLIDDIPVPDSAFNNLDSSSTAISLVLPADFLSDADTLPEQGRPVSVAVRNDRGGDRTNYRVLPAEEVEGESPAITEVVGPNGSSGVVVPGEDAEVRGSNFGGSPDVSLRKGGRELTALTVNQSTATEIAVSVPNQVPGLTFDELGLAEATLRVATGVPPAADRGITVSREVPQ